MHVRGHCPKRRTLQNLGPAAHLPCCATKNMDVLLVAFLASGLLPRTLTLVGADFMLKWSCLCIKPHALGLLRWLSTGCPMDQRPYVYPCRWAVKPRCSLAVAERRVCICSERRRCPLESGQFPPTSPKLERMPTAGWSCGGSGTGSSILSATRYQDSDREPAWTEREREGVVTW